MKIKAFRIVGSDSFVLGENLESIKTKLENAGYSTETMSALGDDKGLKILNMISNPIDLVFDKDDKFVGFVNNKTDGSNTMDIGITIITEDDKEYTFTIGKFAWHLTSDSIDLDEYYLKQDDPEMMPLCGYLNYNKSLMIGDLECVTQCTEMEDYTEVVSLLRKDIVNKLPILFGDKQYKAVNLTALIEVKD